MCLKPMDSRRPELVLQWYDIKVYIYGKIRLKVYIYGKIRLKVYIWEDKT